MTATGVFLRRLLQVLALGTLAGSFTAAVNAQRVIITRPATEVNRAVSLARLSAVTAKDYLQSGEYKLAANAYGQAIDALQNVPADTEQKTVLADAHFGRASALQQGKRSDNTDSSGAEAQLGRDDLTAIRDYDESSALDSARFFSAANNNAALLLHDAGQHREALARFIAATRSPHPARASFLAHVGDEFLELGQADSCLELLALNFATIGLGPSDIARGQLSRLTRVAASEPGTRPGIDALLMAYATVPTASRRAPSGDLLGAEWWSQTLGRRGVWSTVLGGIGRWYDARGADSTAMTYYEAALGIPWRYSEPPEWIDIELVFPLAVLDSADDAQRAAPERLNKFLDGIFQSKLLAYQQRNVPRIRRFHTALGAFFASRNEWRNGPHGAIFQLENMRAATRQLNEGARPADVVRDAPELLQQLVIGYCRTGATEKASALATELATENRRLGRPVAAGGACPVSAPGTGAH